MNTQSEVKHTPGPWELRYTNDGKLELGGSTVQSTGVYSSVGFGLVADVIYKKTNILGDSHKLQQETFEANAKLVAAAPELLKELMHLVRLLEPVEKNGGLDVPGLATLNGAREAIKKATL